MPWWRRRDANGTDAGDDDADAADDADADDAATPLEPPPFPFINSGGYIGYVGALRAMFARIAADVAAHHVATVGEPARDADDQRWLTRYWLAHPDDVAIDAYGEIFLSLFDVDAAHLALADAPATASAAAAAADGECAAPAFDVACNASGFAVSPCVVHGNGGTLKTPFFREIAERYSSRSAAGADLSRPVGD